MTWRRRLMAAWLAGACLCCQASAEPSRVPPEHRRGAEQTLLTFPEWFLVHSPAEYAQLVASQPAHAFPFIRHVGQLWSSYSSVVREQVGRRLDANPGYHVMILVIASSTTLEYTLRAIYENTLGRTSWGLSGARLAAEDRYGARVAQQYVDFIRDQPWYLFPFSEKLLALWRLPLGEPRLRAIERRYALSAEYLAKAAYAKLIETATRAAYEPAKMSTHVILSRAPANAVANVDLLSRFPDGKILATLPRYYRFRIAATELARQGIEFVDVAGNEGPILVSLIAGAEFQPPVGRVLFRQTMASANQVRHVLIVGVAQLAGLLREPGKEVEIEHVYDY